MLARQFFIAVAALLLCGCGQLKVQVDIIDPEYVSSVELRGKLLDQLQFALESTAEKQARADRVIEPAQTEYRKVARRYREKAATVEATDADTGSRLMDIAQGLDDLANQDLSDSINMLRQQLEPIDEEIRRQVTKSDLQGAFDHLTDPIGDLLVRRLIVSREIRDTFEGELEFVCRSQQVETPQENDAAAENDSTSDLEKQCRAARESATEKFARTFIGDGSLTASPAAYAVASADEKFWQRQFNHVFGQGILGNLNFAVKMNDVGDFTIKGLTFDPSEVARVASRVTTQGLLMAAQIAGVPVSQTASDGDDVAGAALAEQSGTLAEKEAEAIERKAKLAAQQDALRLIAFRIIGEERNLLDAGTSASRSAAIKAIDDTFKAHKPRLVLTEDK